MISTPANWPRKPVDVRLNRERLKIDDAQQKLPKQNAEVQRQAFNQALRMTAHA